MSPFRKSRRQFVLGSLAASMFAPLRSSVHAVEQPPSVFDYIVIGGGAGGGPVAARLARAGFTVALLEAGLDPEGAAATQIDPSTGLFYRVPLFAALTEEHPLLSWDFYVKHYEDEQQQRRDSKYVEGKGVLYPRGSALGGSTAHNAMNFAYPHDADWDDIAARTGDVSWRARAMRGYFERVERCTYCAPHARGRGRDGYIDATRFDPRIFELYPQLQDIAEADLELPLSAYLGNHARDINHPLVAKGDVGSFFVPMHTTRQVRVSLREHLHATQLEHPDCLFILTGSLVTRLLLSHHRAVGVELMQGVGLYQASKLYDAGTTPALHTLHARREVIVSAGVFNTPQLLKLSGIGPRHELERHGITPLLDLPGVGENLQDRYEISVTAELTNPVDFYARCLPFTPDDPCMKEWSTGEGLGLRDPPFHGPYAGNTVFGARIARSRPGRVVPDLFLGGWATDFQGFYPGFSQRGPGTAWSWVILRTHNNNDAGYVRLRSRDPRHTPEINFRYFEEGSDRHGEDLEAVLTAVKLARRLLNAPEARQHLARELSPGPSLQTDEELRSFIRDQAWGHHASCTAKMGERGDPSAVVDSAFRVHGLRGLRVVDASVFPRLPGIFPVAAVMMLGEKAADCLLDSKRL